jgi:hypothetical protein
MPPLMVAPNPEPLATITSSPLLIWAPLALPTRGDGLEAAGLDDLSRSPPREPAGMGRGQPSRSPLIDFFAQP